MTGIKGMKKGVKKETCANCDKPLEMIARRYCRDCHVKYMRDWRKANPLSESQRFRITARRKMRDRIERGLLEKYPCEVCGEIEVQAHHDDYSKPYDVHWLCKKHYNEHQKTLRSQGNGEKSG